MKPEINFQIYLGTVRGALASSSCKNDVKSKYDLQQMDGEITALEWGRKDNEILLGNQNGCVRFYDYALGQYTKDITDDLDGEGSVVGLGCFKKHVVAGRRNGIINVWSRKAKESFGTSLDEGSTMECLAYNSYRNTVGTGGEKNDLKLWDVENQTAIFKAKSMGHDELNLPIPTTVRGICFFPSEENLVACATKEGHVLLYDERAQRRPVTKYVEVKASFTSAAAAYRDRQCMVGTTKGYMQLVDLRHNKCVKTFKSFTGGITSIVCDPVEPFVATACLDRHLRIHNINTKELVYKEYMKMGLTKIIMKPVVKEEPEQEVPVVDTEFEELFDKMEKIDDNLSPVKPEKRKSKIKSVSKKKLKA